ncbi:MAG: 1-acyl-sn-glycerol-3-phosphate acyltransferase [Kiritimatiellae bacterium]|nr:1-acyl-sn-glycerol-3-phosphate acyltransferase [Kiritimatiellia bacterium]
MKHRRDTWAYFLTAGLLRIGLKIWNRLSIFGIENVPLHGGGIIVANHTSFLDPPVIGGGVLKRRGVHFLARGSLFSFPLGEWCLRQIQAIPIEREKGDIGALRKGLSVIKEGKLLALFPEGTRSPDGHFQEAKKGVGFLMAKAKIPIIPAYIDGTFQAYPKGGKWIRPKKIKVYFGTPIFPVDLEQFGKKKEAYRQISDYIMSEIKALKDSNTLN